MDSLHGAARISSAQLAAQLEHPNANAIWNRALEVFGEEAKARNWMDSPRDIFGGRTPQDLVASGDAGEQRRVLEVPYRLRRFLLIAMPIYRMHRAGGRQETTRLRCWLAADGIRSALPCFTPPSTCRSRVWKSWFILIKASCHEITFGPRQICRIDRRC
jgi:hypothetical protein